MGLQIVILAAGEGKRLQSNLPKVLHTVAGKPLLQHVIESAKRLSPEKLIVVVGHGAKTIKTAFPDESITWVFQATPDGTGTAVATALPAIAEDAQVLILSGDVPLISHETLGALIDSTPPGSVGMITAEFEDPAQYGRIVRNAAGEIRGIKELKDANDKERSINEINSGIYYVPAHYLRQWLPHLNNNNASAEYYLTDIIAQAVAKKINIVTVNPLVEEEIVGVNTKLQLSECEAFYLALQSEAVMEAGVTLRDPARFDLRGELRAGKDVCIDVNVIFEGEIIIGDNTQIGPNVVLRNVTVGRNVTINAFCHIEGAVIQDNAVIGPFARVRPESDIGKAARIGNFVEIKKSRVGDGSKVNHLSYVGDATLGRDVNVGAGTITCNYDGANKHQTMVGDGLFIGSNVALVAPIVIGEHATIGAGSTVSRDAPAGELTVARSPQKSIAGWKRPKKSKES